MLLIFVTISLAMLACGASCASKTEKTSAPTGSHLNSGTETPAIPANTSSQRAEDATSDHSNKPVTVPIDQTETPSEKEKIDDVKMDIAALITGTLLFLVDNPVECPSVAQIIERKYLRPRFPHQDVWGNDYLINCTKDKVIVTSVGPDRIADSEDDIRRESDR